MSHSTDNCWLHRFAVLTAVATLALIGIGGLVTSHEAGMSVPDWPNSYGYNMFLFPPSKWIGGVLYEHTHRLWASIVGLLVVALTRWLGGSIARRPLAIIGVVEILTGLGMFFLGPNLKATGGFLTGIGGIVLLAAVIWVKNEAAPRRLPQLGWIAFATVQIQGLLGGLRVVLFKDEIGVFHAALAQAFFVLLCVIALMTSRWWSTRKAEPLVAITESGTIRGFFAFATILIFVQLILGATMRHQHAGLAVPDFPLAYGKLWPAMDAGAISHYNQQRVDFTSEATITAFQITLHMIHRLMAVVILAVIAGCTWLSVRKLSMRNSLSKLSLCWLALIVAQASLGAATVLSHKAADVATVHVLIGAVSLAVGAMLTIISYQPRITRSACRAEGVRGSCDSYLKPEPAH